MSKIFLLLIIFLKILIPLQVSSKRCDFSECHHEGQCDQHNSNDKTCTCIGSNYFKGEKCSEPVDNCQNENPCKNGGTCKTIVGQFICQDCNAGFGGLWCDLEVANIFKNMLLYFNHYAFYGETHEFLIISQSLGVETFSLEFTSDNYAIDSFETKPEQPRKWIYSDNLPNIIEKMGIKYYQDLPFLKGYYHVAAETFWDVGLLELSLRCYDTASATQLFYQRQFHLLLLSRQEKCVPHIRFIYGSNPLEPLMLDIASYNNFEVIRESRCLKSSQISYDWKVYNSIGTKQLHDFGHTNELILKIQPYKFWFNYHGEVMSSYRLVVRMVEVDNNHRRETQARCFILVLPKPVTAVIKGGNYKEIGFKQNIILDASSSRDFALAPNVLQDLFFTWDCVSLDDADNVNCRENVGTSSIIKIKSEELLVHKTYNFSLSINSKINQLISDQTYQMVKIMEKSQLNIDIKCLRNCWRNKFFEEDLIYLKAVSVDEKFSKTASFKWSLEDKVIGEKIHLNFYAPENQQIFNIQLVVQDQTLKGEAFKTLEMNVPPLNGSCSIEPLEGEAFLTEFHIKCENYLDPDMPLSYEYLTGKRFPLQRTNEKEIHAKLPQCDAIIIRICDQFQACIENNLEVEIRALEEGKDLQKFVKHQENGLASLLNRGDILSAMILLKSLTNIIKTVDDLAIVAKELEQLKLRTLLQVEQYLELNWDLVYSNEPLSWEKAFVFNKYLSKIVLGLRLIVADNEIAMFKRHSYEKTRQELLQIMQLFAYTWQIMPIAQMPLPQTILSSNPLIEMYAELNEFDIKIAMKLENWLDCSRTLHDCLDLLTVGTKDLYAPWEDTADSPQPRSSDFVVKMFAFDNDTLQDVALNINSVTVILNEACVRELNELFHHQAIQVQAVSLHLNPFWWYPSEEALNSVVFILTAPLNETLKNSLILKNPFEFHLELNLDNFTHHEILGVVNNSLHMPLYTIEMPANAVLVVTFLRVEKPLRFLIKINKLPTSFEVRKSGKTLNNTSAKQSFAFSNPFDNKIPAYMAVLLQARQYENVTFSFYTVIRECLYWDFGLEQPQWSSQGCKPKLETQLSDRLTCYCQHFSTFAARSFQSAIQQHLRKRPLLTKLPLNLHVIEFYLSLALAFALILILNFYKSNQQFKFLSLNSSGFLNNDIEIRIFTGCQLNATTSSNISFKIISSKGSFSLTIHQDPENLFLKRNSVCKLRISSQNVEIPLKLIISNDQSGRYCSWYCHKIIVINLKTCQKQIFLINQWIAQEPLAVDDVKQNVLQFRERFRQNISIIYLNWYQFQPLWGCWQYDDLNRFERSCLELSHVAVSVCLVACYFGRTTLETYEQERELYYFLNFNIFELLLLSLICYMLNFTIKLLFWLLCKIYVVQKKGLRESK